MDWLLLIGGSWLYTLAWVVGLAAAFGVLARCTPCNPGMYWWRDRRAAATDLVYWFIVPLFLRVGRTVMLAAGLVFLLGGREPDLLPVKHWPLGLQCVVIQLLQDFLLYALHRAFHTRPAWRFHAVHHSPEILDWTATGRFHPVNNLLTFGLADVLVLLLGFAPAAVIALAPFNIVYSALVHANLNWTFGPLRYVLASPVFHRWHHTTQEEGLDKNFAATFSFLDVIFGTFYMPAARRPVAFGTGDEAFPRSFWGQFIYPFVRPRQVASASSRKATRLRAVAGALATAASLAGLIWAGVESREPPVATRPEGDMRSVAEESEFDRPPTPEISGDATTFTCRTLQGHAGSVLAVAASTDGHRVVSGGTDGTVRIWDGVTGHELMRMKGHQRPVRAVAVSADGRRAVSAAHDGTVRIWDAGTGRQEAMALHAAGPLLAVALSANGRRMISGAADGTARIGDTTAADVGLDLPLRGGAVLGLAITPDGSRAIAACGDTARVFDPEGRWKPIALAGHRDLVYAVGITADATRAITGSLDGTAKLWEVTAGRELCTLRGHAGPVYGVALTGDGRLALTGGRDGTVRLWDLPAGTVHAAWSVGAASVMSVAFAADGRCMIAAGEDGAVRIWNGP